MIGIIGAMHDEVELLQKEMQAEEIIEKAGMKFHKGSLCGKEAVVVQSGIGKVNAALCAQILVDVFQVDTLINTGIAGSLDAQIDIGDMLHERSQLPPSPYILPGMSAQGVLSHREKK